MSLTVPPRDCTRPIMAAEDWPGKSKPPATTMMSLPPHWASPFCHCAFAFALAEAGLHEGEDGLGDRYQLVLDEARVLLEIVVQAVPGELARQRERAEDRRDDGAVGAPVHHAADDRLNVGRPPGGLHGHGAD